MKKIKEIKKIYIHIFAPGKRFQRPFGTAVPSDAIPSVVSLTVILSGSCSCFALLNGCSTCTSSSRLRLSHQASADRRQRCVNFALLRCSSFDLVVSLVLESVIVK